MNFIFEGNNNTIHLLTYPVGKISLKDLHAILAANIRFCTPVITSAAIDLSFYSFILIDMCKSITTKFGH